MRLDRRTLPLPALAGLALMALALTGCGGKSVYDLEVGDCIVPPEGSGEEQSEVSRVKTVDCAEPHDGEVTAVFDVDLEEYPGDEAIFEIVIQQCPARSSTAIYPTEESWKEGDREAICILQSLFDLSVGDCINYPSSGELLTQVERVDCAEPHDGEVADILTMPDGDYPGDDAVFEYADANCPAETDFELTPTEESWSIGDREITCIDE